MSYKRSYNFSHSADTRNDENVVIFHDPETAMLFAREFERVFNSADRLH